MQSISIHGVIEEEGSRRRGLTDQYEIFERSGGCAVRIIRQILGGHERCHAPGVGFVVAMLVLIRHYYLE